jgi:transposase
VPTYKQIADCAGVSVPTVINTLRDYTKNGLAQAVKPKRNPASDTARLKATGEAEAKIVAKACSKAPGGRSNWTMTLLSDESAVILETPLSRSTVWRILQRNEIHPHLSEYWCIPPEEDAEFVANMEDILDLYQLPYDPKRPLWCMDEKPYQLLGESREPLPMRRGDTRKIDSEYVRNGTASIFCFIQPHNGKIFHFVEETRTAVDWAEKIRYLVDEVEPDAEKIVLVMDNLNTHAIASLYKTFPPEEARRIAKKLEVHYTPKHGSWLDIAEIGINIITRECLDRRIESIDALRSELKEWNDAYDKNPSPINWQFTTADARIKLRRLYPDINKYRENRNNRRLAKQSAS